MDWSAAATAVVGAGVLAAGAPRAQCRGFGGRGRRVAAGGVPVVPRGWRHADVGVDRAEWPGQLAHLSVLTDPAARRRGYAKVVAAAAIRDAEGAGLLPQWRARPLASQRLAASLGLVRVGDQISVDLRG
ncbi:MAG: GNAT family N-acetyltransferase [Mycobacteriales bacterium]